MTLTSDFQSTSGLRVHGGVPFLSHSFTWRSAELVKYKSNIDLHVVLMSSCLCLAETLGAEREHSHLGCKVKRHTAADKLFVCTTGELS